MIDITKPVKLVNPEIGEEDLIFIITNYNDLTQRAMITPINLNMTFPGIELVSIDDIINL
jgi:hypothetical protein